MTIRTGICALVLFIICSICASAGELTDRFKSAYDKSITAVSQASVSRDLALNAFKNAIAMEDEAEDALLSAIRAYNMTNAVVLSKKLAQIKDETEECQECCMNVMALAGDGLVAGESVRQEYERVIDTGTPVRDKSLVKRVERLSEVAESKAGEAAEIAQCLKKKWLEVSIDGIISTAAAVTTAATTIPPSPTPAGNR